MIKRASNHLHRQAGFVLTIEAVLLVTILGIGLFVGIVALRNALFKYALSQQDQDFYVFDRSDPAIVIGKVSHFDEHEAAVVPFIDYGARLDASNDPVNHRALIGIRDDRFTSRQPIFYTAAGCAGTPCIAGPSDEAAYNTGIDGIAGTGSVGYLYALQGVTYGIGAGSNFALFPFRGRLFRQTSDACPAAVVSAWDSQRVVTGSPCIAIAPGPGGLFEAEPVLRQAGGVNVLDPLMPTFYTNMVSTPSTTYTTVPPVGERTP